MHYIYRRFNQTYPFCVGIEISGQSKITLCEHKIQYDIIVSWYGVDLHVCTYCKLNY